MDVKEDLVFAATTQVEPTDYKRFLYFSRLKRKPLTIPILLVIPLVVGCMMAIDSNSFRVPVFFIAFLVMVATEFIMISLDVEKRFKNHISLSVSKKDYAFYADGFSVTYEGAEEDTFVLYTEVEIIETKGHFYLYAKNVGGNIINKRDNTPEICANLTKLFAEKLGTQYKAML